jgi:hypothetical protein
MDFEQRIFTEVNFSKIPPFLGRLQEKFNEKYHNKIELLLKERVKEKLVGVEFDLESESKRRFNRFMTESKQEENGVRSESYYFNDGSKNGLLLLTIFHQPPVFDHSNYQFSISQSFTYK